MALIKWYKRDPDAALQGFFQLTLEERGAYGTVLDLIYSRAGKLPDDDRYLAGCMRCDIRVWKRLKKRLLDLGKIEIRDGIIHNDRADEEVLDALGRVASAAEAGRASGRSRRRKLTPETNKDNGVDPTPVPTKTERTLELTTTTPTVTTGTDVPVAQDPAVLTYQIGKDLLSTYGIAERKAGALITKWRKDVSDEALVAAFMSAGKMLRADIIAFITGSLRHGDEPPWEREMRQASDKTADTIDDILEKRRANTA